jgi:hypothetical protein
VIFVALLVSSACAVNGFIAVKLPIINERDSNDDKILFIFNFICIPLVLFSSP